MGGLGNLGSMSSLRNEFSYNPVVARALATRSVVPPSSYGTGASTSTSTSTSPTSTVSPGASGHEFEYRAPIYPYKSYLSNMAPWGAGYGEDCVDYTIPTGSSYNVVNVNDTASGGSGTGTSAASSVSAGHLVAYQPWDSRGKQVASDADTSSPTMPSGSALLPSSMPPTVSSYLPQHLPETVAPKTAVSATSATSAGSVASNSATSAAGNGNDHNNPGTSLVYRLAPSTDSGDYRHATASLDGDPPRNSVEGIDRLTAEPLSSLSRYKVRELIARSAAPSPVPGFLSAPHTVSRSNPHSVPSSLPHGILHSASSPVPLPSPYTRHINTSSSDRVTALGYPLSTCSSPVDHSIYGASHSNTIPDGSLFSEHDRSAGTQGTAYGPSSLAPCLDSYTYAPSPKTASVPSAVAMARQKGRKTVSPATSAENLAKASSTPTARVYSPTEGPAPPPMSRPSSPALYVVPHQDTRSDSGYMVSRGHSLRQVQNTSSRQG